MMLTEIGEDEIAALISEMREGIVYKNRDGRIRIERRRCGYTPWTIRGVLSPESRVLGHAARRGLIANNPVSRLEQGERPATTEKDKRILLTEEIPRLLRATPAKYRPIVATGIYTGMRLGELLGLTWGDLDFETGFVHVRRQLGPDGTRVEPKTANAVQDIVLLPALGSLLKAERERAFAGGRAKPTDFVFSSDTGTPLQPRNVSRRGLEHGINKAGLSDPGLPRLTMRSLRDTFASHLILDLKLDVVQVSRLLGHAKPSITANTYARLFDKARHAEAVREAMIASPFGNALETVGGRTSRGRPSRSRISPDAGERRQHVAGHALACHAEGRGFESLHPLHRKPRSGGVFCCLRQHRRDVHRLTGAHSCPFERPGRTAPAGPGRAGHGARRSWSPRRNSTARVSFDNFLAR